MTLHNELTGIDLHVTKVHSSEHENGGDDEISLLDLSGKTADKQDPSFDGDDIKISPDALPALFQTIWSLETRLHTLENQVSLLWREAKRANTMFNPDGSW